MNEAQQNQVNEPQQPATTPPAPNFLQLLASHANGYTVDLLTAKVKELVAHLETLAINEGMHKSKATLSVKIVFARDGGPYTVAIEPSLRLPVGQVPKSVFWATPAHALVQQDPRQFQMPFRDVGGSGRRVVDVAEPGRV